VEHRLQLAHVFIALLLAFIVSGCSLASLRPGDDAAVTSSDGATSDAVISRADGGVLLDGACGASVRWLDATPNRFSANLDRSPALVADGAGFGALYTYPDSDACMGYCVAYATLDAAGTSRRFAASWYPHGTPSVPDLYAARAPTGEVGLASVVGSHLWWAGAPSDAGWALRAEAELAEGVRAAGFERDALVVETAITSGTRMGQSIVSRVGPDGTSARVTLDDPTSGFSFWAPQIVTSSEGPWLAVLMDTDFPPTVQLSGPSGGGWDGSSCGVESYDIVAESGASVVVAEDCPSTLHVVRRDRSAFGTRPDHVFDDRLAGSHVRSRIARAGGRLAVVYRATDGAARVAVLDDRLTLLASADVPGSTGDAALVGPLGIAANDDGTFAVLTSARWVSADNALGEASVQRFTLCP